MLLGLLHRPADDPAAAALAARGLTADGFRGALTHDLGAAPSLDAKARLATLSTDLHAVRASVEKNFGPDAMDALYPRRRRDGHRLALGPLCGFALTPRAKRALERARRTAKTEQRRPPATGDLLAGLLAVEDGMAARGGA
jgi:hypothetical protein